MGDGLYTSHPAFTNWSKGHYGGRSLLSEYWYKYRRIDPDLRNIVMCIEVVFSVDKRVFISSRPCNVSSSSTGAEYNYLPVMKSEPELKSSVSIGGSDSSARSFSFELPNELVDASALLKSGRMLAGVAEVSLQYDGGDYDNRLVVMRGEMDSGVSFFPANGGTMQFSITDPKTSLDLILPPYTITRQLFPFAPTESAGLRYPIILNDYDMVPCSWIKGTATTQHLLIGYGLIETDSSDYLWVDGESYSSVDATYGWTVATGSDPNGVTYTYVQFTHNPSTEYKESVYIPVLKGQSEKNPAEQIRYLLRNYTAFDDKDVNSQRFSAAVGHISGVVCSALVNSGSGNDTTTLGFIEGGICGSFPMLSMAWMMGGYGPVVVDRNAAKIGLKLNSKAHPIMARATAVQEKAKNELYNSFTVEYKFNAMDNIYEEVVQADRSTNAVCNISAQQIGLRQHDTIQCPFVKDDNTAQQVLDWLVLHLALPSYYVEYECVASVFFSVALGDNLSLTDEDFGWEDLDATVVSLSYKSGKVVLGLQVWSPHYSNIGGSYAAYPRV